MAEPTATESEPPAKRSKKSLLIGFILAMVLGGGGFYAVWSGMILAQGNDDPETASEEFISMGLPDVAFVPIQPLIINIGSSGANRYLRFEPS